MRSQQNVRWISRWFSTLWHKRKPMLRKLKTIKRQRESVSSVAALRPIRNRFILRVSDGFCNTNDAMIRGGPSVQFFSTRVNAAHSINLRGCAIWTQLGKKLNIKLAFRECTRCQDKWFTSPVALNELNPYVSAQLYQYC